MNPFRILHAENDKTQAHLLARLIHRVLGPMLSCGIAMTNVTTLKEALTLTHEHDATIFDLHLDDAGEAEVIAAFRACREPIIVMTAVGDNALERRCLDAGATHVFVKAAFDEVELCKCIIGSFLDALKTQEAQAA